MLDLLVRTDDAALGARLIQNDRRYFRAGAEVFRLGPCELFHLEGLEHTPAGCMVEGSPASIVAFLPTLLARLQTAGAKYLRCYLEGNVHSPQLERLGFLRALEPTLALDLSSPPPPSRVRTIIRPATVLDDGIKAQLFASDGKLPDGKGAKAADYVALERRKIDAGYMQSYLVYSGGEPVGCFSLSEEEGVVRMKNLFVHVRRRGEGILNEMIRFCHAEGRRQRADAVGVFALAGAPGHRAYLRAGLREVGVQTEYALPIRVGIPR